MISRCARQEGAALRGRPLSLFENPWPPSSRMKLYFGGPTKFSSFDHGRDLVLNNQGEGSKKRADKQPCQKSAVYAGWSKISCYLESLTCGLNRMHDHEETSKETHRDGKPKLVVTARKIVFTGMLGVAFGVLWMGWSSVTAFSCVIPLRLLHTTTGSPCWARPTYPSQFSAITAAVHHQPFSLDAIRSNLGFITQGFPRVSYIMDVLLERHPITYILLLAFFCCALISIGGILFSKYRSRDQTLQESFWDSWACLCSSSTHLKERTFSERVIGLLLAIGGLFFYSLLTSTMTAQFKSRMEWLREGAHSEVKEEGHIVICGINNHLTTVLKQLNKSQELAIQNGSTFSQKQTVLLLSEHDRKMAENMVSHVRKNCPRLNILTRSGSLSNSISFQKVAADKARVVIVLASNDDGYEADAESVLTVLALQPLLEGSSGKLVVEVFDSSTADLLKSYKSMQVDPLQNLSSKIFVQCSRQRGLIQVYQELLDHNKQVINLRNYPVLAGVRYQQVRKGFTGAVVCGLIRGKRVDFHPQDQLQLEGTDKLILICSKDAYKEAPPQLLELNIGNAENDPEKVSAMPSSTLMQDFSAFIGKNPCKAADWQVGPKERILMLGWHSSVSEMVQEYDDYVGHGSELIILSEVPLEERKRVMDHKIGKNLKNVKIIHQVGNPMSRSDLKLAISHTSSSLHGIKRTAPMENKNPPLSIVVIADHTMKLGDISKPDKRSIFALLLAESLCKESKVEVASLVAQIVDIELGKEVMKLRPDLTFIGTDEITGLVTAQVAEQSQLNKIWTELLNSWGNEIYMKDIRRYLKPGKSMSFAEISERAVSREEVAIGYRKGNQTVINPPLKNDPLSFNIGDSVVVISEFEYSLGSV